MLDKKATAQKILHFIQANGHKNSKYLLEAIEYILWEVEEEEKDCYVNSRKSDDYD